MQAGVFCYFTGMSGILNLTHVAVEGKSNVVQSMPSDLTSDEIS